MATLTSQQVRIFAEIAESFFANDHGDRRLPFWSIVKTNELTVPEHKIEDALDDLVTAKLIEQTSHTVRSYTLTERGERHWRRMTTIGGDEPLAEFTVDACDDRKVIVYAGTTRTPAQLVWVKPCGDDSHLVLQTLRFSSDEDAMEAANQLLEDELDIDELITGLGFVQAEPQVWAAPA